MKNYFRRVLFRLGIAGIVLGGFMVVEGSGWTPLLGVLVCLLGAVPTVVYFKYLFSR